MEFKKTVKKQDPADQFAEKLKEWPECFYLERDPNIRLALLDAADAAGLTPKENGIRRELFLRRYPKITGKSGNHDQDAFLNVWLDFKFMAENGNGFFSKSANSRKMKKELELLGVTEAESAGEPYKTLVGKELYHLAMLYISLCLEDKSYGAMILGLGRMSDGRLAEKIRTDVKTAAIDFPAIMEAEQECSLWTETILSAYADMFPDEEPLV